MENADKILQIIKEGGPIAGGAAGAALGIVSDGPVGAALGAAVGSTIGRIVEDLAARALSHRERMRVGATASYAIDFTSERLAAGDKLREDGFFDNFEFGRSAAEEIFDGVLSKAKTDHEELKARYYGKFFANVAFDSSCSRSEANMLLHLLERLTYAQLIIVSVFASPADCELPAESYENKTMSPDLLQTLLATFELSQIGLLKLWSTGTDLAEALLDMGEIRPRDIGLSMCGRRFVALAGLEDVPQAEREKIAAILRSAREGNGPRMTEISAVRNR